MLVFTLTTNSKLKQSGGREGQEGGERERVGYRIYVQVSWLKVRQEGAFFLELLWGDLFCCRMMLPISKNF